MHTNRFAPLISKRVKMIRSTKRQPTTRTHDHEDIEYFISADPLSFFLKEQLANFKSNNHKYTQEDMREMIVRIALNACDVIRREYCIGASYDANAKIEWYVDLAITYIENKCCQFCDGYRFHADEMMSESDFYSIPQIGRSTMREIAEYYCKERYPELQKVLAAATNMIATINAAKNDTYRHVHPCPETDIRIEFAIKEVDRVAQKISSLPHVTRHALILYAQSVIDIATRVFDATEVEDARILSVGQKFVSRFHIPTESRASNQWNPCITEESLLESIANIFVEHR